MLDVDDQAYKNFCESIAIPSDIYTDKEDFIRRYLFDSTDYNSIYSNMLRAFDNGVILRDELSSTTLSYLQMALDCMEQKGSTGAVIYDLQPVLDDIFAFWGCLDDKVEDEEAFLKRFASVTDAIRELPYCQGYCYTQLTDVMQEINGLLSPDRQPKVDPESFRKLNGNPKGR